MNHAPAFCAPAGSGRLCWRLLSAGFVALLSGPASAQDSSAGAEQAIRVIGTDGSTQIVEIDQEARTRLAAGPESAQLTSVPLTGGRSADFLLQRFEVWTPDAELVAFDGLTTTALARPDVVFYRGHAQADPAETVFLSVSKSADGEVRMLSSHPKLGASVIAPDQDTSGRTIHRLAPADGAGLEAFTCHADELPLNEDAMKNVIEPQTSFDVRSSTLLEAELMVDVTNHLFTTSFASDHNRALTYVGNLIGACSAIYQRDMNVVLTVKQATVWTTPDPFDGSSSDVQLTNYMNWVKANRSGVARDVAHLLGGRRSYGGIAYVGAMCNTNYGYGVSNIYGTYTYPTSSYTWDVNCVAHELGHNFSSPHTQCYSPPIDCCYSDCGCGSVAPEAGTIMSYCHLTNNTGTVGLYFHQRCVDKMRAYVEGRTCLSAYNAPATPKITVHGNNVTIPNGDWTPSVTEATSFGPGRIGGGGDVHRTYVIRNSGTGTLSLTGSQPVTISGTHPWDYWVSAQPSASIAPGASTTFQVTFRPAATGSRSALIWIPTNDPVDTAYSFWVEGSGTYTGTRTYSWSGAASIPDNTPSGVEIPITVSNFPGLLADVNLQIGGGSCSAEPGATGVGISHTYVADLFMTLRSPSGREVYLMGGSGGNGNNMCSVLLDDQGGGPSIGGIAPAQAPYPGTYVPASPLSAFNGEDPTGTWRLKVWDTVAGDTGVARNVSLILKPRGSYTEQFTGSPTGWIASGADQPGLCTTEFNSWDQSLRIWVAQHPSQPRVMGWLTNDPGSRIPYSLVGSDRYVRAKFHVYAGGQASGALNQVPNMRMRVANRFAVSSVLEVLHHSNFDPESSTFGQDFRPSKDMTRPSVYRVDFDPVDVPYLQTNADSEYLLRMFEAYATEPQENGFVALTESSMSIYPALSDSGVPVTKLYASSRNDFSGTVFSAYNVSQPVTYPVGKQTTGSDLPRGSVGTGGITLDTLRVPSSKLGIVTADVVPGASSEDHDPARRARVEENKIYKIRFHATSTVATSQQPHIRFRARTGKFSWIQKLEVGGAWAIGTDLSSPNAAIAQQALPGVGSRNPDQMNSGEAGGWYTMLFHSPLNREIRADYGNVPLTTSMPHMMGQDGPGVNTGRTRRDINIGIDLIDSISPGPNAWREQGQLTVDRVEIRAYNRPGE